MFNYIHLLRMNGVRKRQHSANNKDHWWLVLSTNRFSFSKLVYFIYTFLFSIYKVYYVQWFAFPINIIYSQIFININHSLLTFVMKFRY
jgi:hypothetical protein